MRLPYPLILSYLARVAWTLDTSELAGCLVLLNVGWLGLVGATVVLKNTHHTKGNYAQYYLSCARAEALN